MSGGQLLAQVPDFGIQLAEPDPGLQIAQDRFAIAERFYEEDRPVLTWRP